ncbi:MAG: DUF1592 domain-containing protein [Myxococcota bacterium]
MPIWRGPMDTNTTASGWRWAGCAVASFAMLATACYGGKTSGPHNMASGGDGADDADDADDVDEDTGDGDDGDDGDSGADIPESPDCSDVGPRMLRRLTSAQLHRTLQTIFEDPAVPEGQVLNDPVVHGFRVDATQAVIRDLDAQQVMQYAESIAAWAVDEKLAQVTPCQDHGAACHEQIAAELGAKFHREPLEDEMVAAYAAVMADQVSFEDGVRELVAALVQSPYFLYRWELGRPSADDPDRFVLTDYELASNLAYSLTGGPPDAELMDLARDGALQDTETLVAQVRRLTSGPEGQAHLAEFLDSWLEVEDLPSRAKAEEPGVMFDDALRQDMLAETRALFLDVFNSGGDVATLLTADYTFVNQRLGHFYRMWEANTEDHQRMEIPTMGEGVRAPGLLGHGSVLARHALPDNSSPVARGVLVRRRLLCQDLPDPPADVETTLDPIPDGTTNRERYELHTSDPACAGCHVLIDPVGFTFEHYDHFGRWRDTEGNQPVDATGELAGVSTGTTALDGLDSLAAALAETDDARECFASYMAYFTYGLDECNPEAIADGSGGPDATLASTLEAIVTAPHFRERRP